MAVEVFSPATVYATKGNIKAPAGTVAATVQSAAQSRMVDALTPFGGTAVTVTIPVGNIQVANP